MPFGSRLGNDVDVLAVDAGGTATRAVLVDAEGCCRGYGRAGGGNPTSAGAALAVAAVGDAVEQAMGGSEPGRVSTVLVANAGGAPDYVPGIERRLAALGVEAPVTRVGDLLALFASGTPATRGAALIAGTGAIGGALRDGRIARTVDGTGWLLGDGGSGFWIGHRVARAVVDDLDGGPPTRLTAALLARLGLAVDEGAFDDGRRPVLGRLVSQLYALRPVQLATFAPLAFAAHEQDEIASAIIAEAVSLLADLLRRVRRLQADGPLVFGGSVLVEGVLRLPDPLLAPLLDAAGDSTPIPVPDGLVGAAVLALRQAGTEVDAVRFAALSASVRARTPIREG